MQQLNIYYYLAAAQADVTAADVAAVRACCWLPSYQLSCGLTFTCSQSVMPILGRVDAVTQTSLRPDTILLAKQS